MKFKTLCVHHTYGYGWKWLEAIHRFFFPLKVCKECGSKIDGYNQALSDLLNELK